MHLGFFSFVRELFYQPKKVFIICFCLSASALLFEGTLISLWSLSREKNYLQHKISNIQGSTSGLRAKIAKAKDPVFLERQARDRFDLVEENDLIFVFPGEQ